VLLTGLLSFPACQAYDLVIVLGSWILLVLLDMLFGWILSLCVDGLDPSYAYGDAWDMGVGWQVTVHVVFFLGNQGIG